MDTVVEKRRGDEAHPKALEQGAASRSISIAREVKPLIRSQKKQASERQPQVLLRVLLSFGLICVSLSFGF